MFFEYEKKEPSTLEDYLSVEDGVLVSPNLLWKEAQTKFSRKEILEFVGNIIREHDLEFPFRPYEKRALTENFNLLKGSPHVATQMRWQSYRLPKTIKCEYLGNPYTIRVESGKRFTSLSNAFVERVRLEASYKGNIAPLDYWAEIKGGATPKHLTPLFMKKCINHYYLYESFQNSSAIKTVTQFKPSIAKALYDFFGAKNVLDFCSGWGDRLVGFLASDAQSYVGIDPNTKLHKPYQDIVDFYAPHKKTTFFSLPAEEVAYEDLTYDFVFTSPPYFDLEHYTQEDTQSILKHPTLDRWKNDFLFYSLKKVYEGLDEGGRIAINISDFNSKSGSICTDMIDFMRSIGATYEGTIGYLINPAQAVKKFVDDDDLAEPIFIWSKGEAPEPKWHQDNFFGV